MIQIEFTSGTRRPPLSSAIPLDAGRRYGLLAGRKILLVEDEALVAVEIELALQMQEALVIGPAMDVSLAVKLASEAIFDGAILDISINGGDALLVADILTRRDIPFLFHSAHGQRVRGLSKYDAAPVCSKPIPADQLMSHLASILQTA
ncbi:MAG: response regulator [Pseudomonadota bacterium]